jgi:hypothetical protein
VKSDPSLSAQAVASVDDVPMVARLLARQQFFRKWYKPVALAPFALMLFIILKFFPNANGGFGTAVVFATLGWALAVVGYSFYLMFAVRCPACNSRYGIGQNCRSCNLPRHRGSTEPISLPKLV